MVTSSGSQTISAWGAGQKYTAGQLVTYDGVTYEALVAETSIATWDPAATPSLWAVVTAPVVIQPPQSSSSTTVTAWSATTVYTAGMTASEGGIIYQANWWTEDNDPAHNNGGAGSGQPWTIVPSGPAPTPVPVPATPTGLAASGTTTSATTLTWNAASVPGGGTVTGYAVFENGSQIAETAGLTYTITALAASTTYQFAVDAIDATGPSAQSKPLSVTTATPVPTPPPVDGVAAWSATTVYTAGMEASENGAVYLANWWNEGDDPAINNAPAGGGLPWTFIEGVPPPLPLASVPTGLAALGTTNTATLLTWNASPVANNGTVTGYAVFENGTQIGTAVGPSYVLTGLSADTTYKFAVEALDAGGASAPSTTLSVTTAASAAPGSVRQIYSPYVDTSLFADENLLAISQASGVKNFTLAFIQSSGPDTIGWAGTGTIDQDTQPNGISIQSEVQSLQAEGGHITISFGGENGTDPATVATSAAALQAEYQSVIDRYGVTSLDFDIEGAAVANTASMHLRDEALIGLKAANPGLTISFTLPVLPTGLDSNGLNVLQTAKADGLDPDVINVMAMDYGASVDQGGEMGVDAISAAIYTEQQIQFVGLASKVGITPMIGLNDTPGETFTLADAQMLVDFAQGNPAIASLGNWSIARDNGATAGVSYVSPDSSGLAQTPYEFASILKTV